MSFDLILYRDRDTLPLEGDEVDRVVLAIPNTRRTARDIREYTCDDPQSGQSYRMVLSYDTAAANGIHASGPTLDVSLDYTLPQFVLDHAATTVFHIAGQLRLSIHILGEQRAVAEPHTPNDLLASFSRRKNAALDAARGQRVGVGLVKVSREKSEYRRSFLQRRGVIEDSVLGLDVHVPDQIVLMHSSAGDSGVHVVRWPDCIPMVFPQVDYVLVARDKRGLFGLPVGRDEGYVPFSQIMKLLGNELVRVEQPVLHYLYRRPEPRPEVKKAADQLHLISLKSLVEPEPQDVVEL